MVMLTGAAQAGLVDRGGGMIYDDVLDITWLADMNYATTSNYDSDGRMTWAAANTWANNLVYGGYSDWRLPKLNPLDTTCGAHLTAWGFPDQYYGYNCEGGELSHLFVFDLGNGAGSLLSDTAGDTTTQVNNLALFSNVQSYYYWSGTEYAPDLSFAWVFSTNNGAQDFVDKRGAPYAVAVRPGDVAAAVPEPQTLALALMALGAAAVARRRWPA
jgi:MYXO-CTERM domain-containing protein